jgi:Fur family iron response transcriptional regulator
MNNRPFTQVIELLDNAGLRPTRQRMALARLLFGDGNRHVTAEDLHRDAKKANIPVSLATVYNNLHQFTSAGLLREMIVEPGKAYFDTNLTSHHHFFFEDTGEIEDIPDNQVAVAHLPKIPQGTTLNRVDVVVRVRASKQIKN